MAGGQAIDLAHVGQAMTLPELTSMHRMKTGALIRASILLGAQCGRTLDGDEEAALDAFARAAGLAFQVVDDVLDVEGSADSLGKTAGKDAAQNKPTYVTRPRACGGEAPCAGVARRGARRPRRRSARARAGCVELADWITQRTH